MAGKRLAGTEAHGRVVQEPTVNEQGYEVHPAWGMYSVHRSQVGPAGAVLFDSDIRHHNVISLRLHEAERKRGLNHDHNHAGKVISEVTFSESQWAAFVASVGQGSGVPCTINWRESLEDPRVPEMPYAPRIQESLAEVRAAGEEAIQKIRAAFEVVKEKPNKGNLRHLEAMIDNAPSNMTFAASSLAKHAEKVVDHAKADLEAFVVDKAAQLGIEPGELGVPQLLPGDDDEYGPLDPADLGDMPEGQGG